LSDLNSERSLMFAPGSHQAETWFGYSEATILARLNRFAQAFKRQFGSLFEFLVKPKLVMYVGRGLARWITRGAVLARRSMTDNPLRRGASHHQARLEAERR
jgi:hypothetical protein